MMKTSLTLTLLTLLLAHTHAKCRFSYKKRTFVPYGCLPTPSNLPDCSVCEDPSWCSSGICLRNRCVQDSPESHRECFGPTQRPECAPCYHGSDCETGLCLNEKCAKLTKKSIKKCFGSGRCFRDVDTGKRVCLKKRVKKSK